MVREQVCTHTPHDDVVNYIFIPTFVLLISLAPGSQNTTKCVYFMNLDTFFYSLLGVYMVPLEINTSRIFHKLLPAQDTTQRRKL